ncbi:hypothetical protein D9756_002348 [Leucocoprinus leucothites]|uniref:Uncharacterized protein n=1 Tax=Leucocoprinus leucothites TaxID=201217 RepID=A0A8H5LLT6_9AGAR|nr:hypothetical protein D9756_002348 [Leucoagaricus leucothites]
MPRKFSCNPKAVTTSENDSGDSTNSSTLGFLKLKSPVIRKGEFGHSPYPEKWDVLSYCLKVRHKRKLPLKDLIFAECKRLRKCRIMGIEKFFTGSVAVLGKERLVENDLGVADGVETEYGTEDEAER